MHDKGAAGGFLAQSADKIGDYLIIGLLIDADTVFDGNRAFRCRILHGVQTIGHQSGFVHQTGAERAFLHARAGTAAIEVDFIVMPSRRFLRGGGQRLRFAAAQL